MTATTALAATSNRRILALALPAMGALAADPLLGLVDTALVGRLGTAQLAALGIDVAVFSTVFWAFNFLTYGTTAEVARLRGAGRPTEAAAHAVQALWLAVGCGALVTAVLLSAGPLVVAAMGATGAVVEPALAYLRIRALAAVPVLVVAVGHGALRGLQDTRTPLAITVAANLGNAGLSAVLIHAAGLGVAGAALGTVIAQSGAAAAFLVLGRRRLGTPPLALEPTVMCRIVRVSRSLFLRTVSLLAGLLFSTAMAARMGATTVAAHQIARELWAVLSMVLDGFAIAGQALVASALGAGRPAVARADARRLVGWGLAAGALVGVGYLALVGPLPLVFTADEAVLEQVRAVWLVVAVLQPVGGVVFVLDGVLMGAGDFRFLLLSSAASVVLGLVPVALVALALGWGLTGVWAGLAAMMAVRLATTVARLAGGRWMGAGAAEGTAR